MKTTSLVLSAALISICSGMLGGFASYELFKHGDFGVIRASGIDIIDANGKVRSRLVADGEAANLSFLSPEGWELLRLGTRQIRSDTQPVFEMNNSSGRTIVEIFTYGENATMSFDGDHDTHLTLGQFPPLEKNGQLDKDIQPISGKFFDEWGLAVETGSLHSTSVGIVESPDGHAVFVSPVSEHH